MAFPDDYKRVQQPGAPTGIVASTLFLARQLAVNTDDWTVLLGDGATNGGFRVLMESHFNSFMQANAPFGTKAYIEAGTDGLTPELARLWKASEFTAAFSKLADISTPSAWFIKDSAMPDVLRAYSKSLGDANNALVSGFYRFDPASAANMPAGIPSTGPWHMMVVNAMSAQNVIQVLYLRDGTGKIFTRSYTDGVWQAWVQSTGITLTDLNTRVAKSGDAMTGPLTLKTSNAASASLKIADGVAPTTPADGDIWRQDSAGGLLFREGAATLIIRDSKNTATAFIVDQKNGVAGGGSSLATGWNTRDLNTELYDPYNIVTVSANQFTPAFDCEVEWNCPFFRTEYVRTRLYNVTDGVVVQAGNIGYTSSSSSTQVWAGGSSTVIAGKTYRIEYALDSAITVNGLGTSAIVAGVVTFTEVKLRRI